MKYSETSDDSLVEEASFAFLLFELGLLEDVVVDAREEEEMLSSNDFVINEVSLEMLASILEVFGSREKLLSREEWPPLASGILESSFLFSDVSSLDR